MHVYVSVGGAALAGVAGAGMQMCVRMYVCLRVWVCVCERERERERECVYMC